MPLDELKKKLFEPMDLKIRRAKQDASTYFTQAVVLLPSLIDFRAIELKKYEGFKSIAGISLGGVDVLADNKSLILLPINCTINIPKRDELQKSRSVADKLAKEIFKGSFVVKPIYFTPQPARLAKRDVKKLVLEYSIRKIWNTYGS